MKDTESQLPLALIDAYKGTTYRANAGAEWVELRIGIRSRDLLNLYERQGQDTNISRSAAFITAWNPFSEERTPSENAAANAALEADLRACGLLYFHGEGQGSDPQWAPEASFLALGLTKQAAIDLGRRYDQNAIVFAGDDAVPHLMLLR
jgi:hypothetical protein